MRLLVSTILVTAMLCLAPTASWAELEPYSQDFEELAATDGDPFNFNPSDLALIDEGWLVFGNVFNPAWVYLGGYGPFGAPNGGFDEFAFSAVVPDEGDPQQGDQQLSVFNDYGNPEHFGGINFVEANVYREQTIGAGDVGNVWRLEFDAKRGDLAGETTALAFFKTFDGGALTNFITADMTSIPQEWNSYVISILINPSLEGQVLQFGFLNLTRDFQPSTIFYDNVNFTGKKTICHSPPGNPANARTLSVGPDAANQHISNHDDTLGPCPTISGILEAEAHTGVGDDNTRDLNFRGHEGVEYTTTDTNSRVDRNSRGRSR